jgi:hypothetical protein
MTQVPAPSPQRPKLLESFRDELRVRRYVPEPGKPTKAGFVASFDFIICAIPGKYASAAQKWLWQWFSPQQYRWRNRQTGT